MKRQRDREIEERADRLLDVREVAAMLGVKHTTVYQWAYQRRLPVIKLMGHALRFRLSDIQRLIAKGERPALRSPGEGP